MRLGDLDALKERSTVIGMVNGQKMKVIPISAIDNAPTVEVPEEVSCVLTMFGKCSYNKTGCSDCEIKDKIRKALSERPQGEDVLKEARINTDKKCSFCENHCKDDTLYESSSWDGGIGFDYIRDIKFCPLCGKELRCENER